MSKCNGVMVPFGPIQSDPSAGKSKYSPLIFTSSASSNKVAKAARCDPCYLLSYKNHSTTQCAPVDLKSHQIERLCDGTFGFLVERIAVSAVLNSYHRVLMVPPKVVKRPCLVGFPFIHTPSKDHRPIHRYIALHKLLKRRWFDPLNVTEMRGRAEQDARSVQATKPGYWLLFLYKNRFLMPLLVCAQKFASTVNVRGVSQPHQSRQRSYLCYSLYPLKHE